MLDMFGMCVCVFSLEVMLVLRIFFCLSTFTPVRIVVSNEAWEPKTQILPSTSVPGGCGRLGTRGRFARLVGKTMGRTTTGCARGLRISLLRICLGKRWTQTMGKPWQPDPISFSSLGLTPWTQRWKLSRLPQVDPTPSSCPTDNSFWARTKLSVITMLGLHISKTCKGTAQTGHKRWDKWSSASHNEFQAGEQNLLDNASVMHRDRCAAYYTLSIVWCSTCPKCNPALVISHSRVLTC